MQQFMAQLQQMFAAPGSGPVNWDLAKNTARQTVAISEMEFFALK